jgi:hypothetical protein
MLFWWEEELTWWRLLNENQAEIDPRERWPMLKMMFWYSNSILEDANQCLPCPFLRRE